MFRENKRHLQPYLISNVNDLPEKHRKRLETSWAGVFQREFFRCLKEEPFAILFTDVPSRPNIPVNVLVGLEYLKAGFGWSDEELYDAFIYNMQVRYALGYQQLGEGDFDLRTLYNFRQRRSAAHQYEGCNLRAAVEATVREVKHPFPAGKLPVRGKFRMTCLLIGSAAMCNVRRIQRYLALIMEQESKMKDIEKGQDIAQGPRSNLFFLFWQSLFPSCVSHSQLQIQ